MSRVAALPGTRGQGLSDLIDAPSIGDEDLIYKYRMSSSEQLG